MNKDIRVYKKEKVSPGFASTAVASCRRTSSLRQTNHTSAKLRSNPPSAVRLSIGNYDQFALWESSRS
jgi:hypothetical protein